MIVQIVKYLQRQLCRSTIRKGFQDNVDLGCHLAPLLLHWNGNVQIHGDINLAGAVRLDFVQMETYHLADLFVVSVIDLQSVFYLLQFSPCQLQVGKHKIVTVGIEIGIAGGGDVFRNRFANTSAVVAHVRERFDWSVVF